MNEEIEQHPIKSDSNTDDRLRLLETAVRGLEADVRKLLKQSDSRETEDGPVLGPINPGSARWFVSRGLDTRLDYARDGLSQIPLSQISRDQFYPLYYLQLYPDVRQAYGADNVEGAIAHYRTYGIKEGRDPSPFFSPKYYLSLYPDLRHAYGPDNYEEALGHWLRHGIDEGRRGSEHFDVKFYLSSHPDLVQTYGESGHGLAFEHWKRHGNAEGRKTAPEGGMRVAYFLGDVRDIDNNHGSIHGLMGFVASGEAGASFTITRATIGATYQIAGVLLTVHAIASLVIQEHHRQKMKKLRQELHKAKEQVERERFRELDRRNYEAERIERYRDVAFV